MFDEPNRYNTTVYVEVRSQSAHVNSHTFGDLQSAYLWIRMFMNDHPGTWSYLPEFVQFADQLDRKVDIQGVRSANIHTSSEQYRISAFYGYLII